MPLMNIQIKTADGQRLAIQTEDGAPTNAMLDLLVRRMMSGEPFFYVVAGPDRHDHAVLHRSSIVSVTLGADL